MSPFCKKQKWLTAMAVSLCALAHIYCGDESSKPGDTVAINGESANVMLQMNYVSAPLIDSLVVDAFGSDTIHKVIDPESPYLDMDLFPGDHWEFKAKLYANGALMQTGELTTALEAGKNKELDLQMHAIMGFVYVEIPLGFGNPAGIAKGNLTLSNGSQKQSFAMEINGTNAIFKSGMLALGKTYSLELSMQDSEGTDIYSVQDSLYLSEKAPVPELQIKSLRSKVSMALQLANDVNMQIGLTLPSINRAVKPGDLAISEFLVNPAKGDSNFYEFIEIYNGSLDTLKLKNCYLGKNSGTKEAILLEEMTLPPRNILVVGNDSNPNTPKAYRHSEDNFMFSKSSTATSSAIVLHCNGSVIDSVYYGKLDETHVNRAVFNNSSSRTKSSQLNIERYETRTDSSSWCLGNPTPGILSFCE